MSSAAQSAAGIVADGARGLSGQGLIDGSRWGVTECGQLPTAFEACEVTGAFLEAPRTLELVFLPGDEGWLAADAVPAVVSGSDESSSDEQDTPDTTSTATATAAVARPTKRNDRPCRWTWFFIVGLLADE